MNLPQFSPEASERVEKTLSLFSAIRAAHLELDVSEVTLLRALFPDARAIKWDYTVGPSGGPLTFIDVESIWLERSDGTTLTIPHHDDFVFGDWSEGQDTPAVQACLERLETEGIPDAPGALTEPELLKQALAIDLGLPVDQLKPVLGLIFDIALRNVRENEISEIVLDPEDPSSMSSPDGLTA
jgi:hypothetical protein